MLQTGSFSDCESLISPATARYNAVFSCCCYCVEVFIHAVSDLQDLNSESCMRSGPHQSSPAVLLDPQWTSTTTRMPSWLKPYSLYITCFWFLSLQQHWGIFSAFLISCSDVITVSAVERSPPVHPCCPNIWSPTAGHSPPHRGC